MREAAGSRGGFLLAGGRRARGRLRAAGSIFLLSLAVLLALGPLVLSPGILMRGDVALYFYPYWQAAAEATRAGRLPLWNPDLFAGAPFLANPQVGFFYPPNRVLSGLPPPLALKVSILLHALGAAWGMAGLARRLGYRAGGALAAGLAYALGGYFLAQAEHINQFQALAWLPWMAWAWAAGRWVALGLAAAMQALCGHAQTVFISWVGLGIFFAPFWKEKGEGAGAGAWRVGGKGGLLALGLAAVQWLPALELARVSIRAEGLPLREALSFSLHPLLLGRSLLPGREATAFSEFAASIGLLGGLALAWGIGRPGWARWGALAGLGLFFALGGYNPVYGALAAALPPLRAFRVPARWLALWAFGAALGVGAGIERGRDPAARRAAGGWALSALALMGLAAAAAPFQAPGMTGPIGPVAPAVGIRWALTLLLGGLIVGLRPPRPAVPLLGLGAAELIAAAWGLPVNRLTAPEAWSDLRPATAVLQDVVAREGPWAGRVLSVVDLRFDPGDLGEWRSLFAGRLSPEAFAEFLVATKQKEALVPNLPLAYRLPTVDGYDGGVLPLRRYIELARRFVPEDRLLLDGRLWETLPQIPEPKGLQLLGVRWIVADRLRDVWIDGVLYDRGLSFSACGAALVAGRFPPFEATGLRLLIATAAPPGARLGTVAVLPTAGPPARFPVRAGEPGKPAAVVWGEPRRVAGVRVEADPAACAGEGWRVEGGALVDERTGAFQALVFSPGGAFERIYAGDVKIYAFRDALPRAYGVCAAVHAPDAAAAFARLSDPGFDPAQAVVLEGAGPEGVSLGPPCSVEIRWERFAPEERILEARFPRAGWLVLMEAFAPGWRAFVDGRPVPVLPANGLFQAVAVPEGIHTVRWVYRPDSLGLGGGITLLSGLFLIVRAAARRAAA